jgi:Arc/MetJ-type ribon-helix-helix transcriptional regulator
MLDCPALSATVGLGVRRFLVTVHLPPRIERIVKDAVLSGQCRSAEDVLSEAIAVWQARQTGLGESTEDERQAAIERLKSFGKTHKLSLGGMTIKQLRDEARP